MKNLNDPQYLQASDLDGEVTLTIERRNLEEFLNPDTGETEKRWVVYFKEDSKPLILDRENFETINKLVGGPTHH